MSLYLIALIIFASVATLLYIGSLTIQNWLYSTPADNFAIRTLVSALTIAGFITFWCWIDTRNPGRYETIFSFSSYDSEDYDFVDAIKKIGDEEKAIRYSKISLGSRMAWRTEAGQEFRRADSEGPVIAIVIQDKDKPIRFNTKIDAKGNLPTGEIQYKEVKGNRYIEGTTTIGRVYKPGTWKVIICLLLNFAQFVVWTVALWLGMGFALGHAMSMAAGVWIVVTLLVMPVLFTNTRKVIKTNPNAPPIVQPAETKETFHFGQSSQIPT